MCVPVNCLVMLNHLRQDCNAVSSHEGSVSYSRGLYQLSKQAVIRRTYKHPWIYSRCKVDLKNKQTAIQNNQPHSTTSFLSYTIKVAILDAHY